MAKSRRKRRRVMTLLAVRMEGGLELTAGSEESGRCRCGACGANGGFWRGHKGFLVRGWRHKKGCPKTPPPGFWDEPGA